MTEETKPEDKDIREIEDAKNEDDEFDFLANLKACDLSDEGTCESCQ